jgi:hypothetical protein
MRMVYTSHLEMLESPQMRKLEKEFTILCQLVAKLDLQEHMNWLHENRVDASLYQEDDGKPPARPPSQGMFTSNLDKVWPERDINVECVFAARVHMDVLDICGQDFRGQEILVTEAKKINKSAAVHHATGVSTGWSSTEVIRISHRI